MNSHCIFTTKLLGDLLLVSDSTHLIGVHFADCQRWPAPLLSKADPDHRILKLARKQLEEYLAGRRKEFAVPLQFEGTAFQRAVWKNIAGIPFGKTISYSDLAIRAGNGKAVRAAGSATGRNPIAVIIPCHRILAMHGALGGFGGGLERKMRLLELEGIGVGKGSQRASRILASEAPHVHARL